MALNGSGEVTPWPSSPYAIDPDAVAYDRLAFSYDRDSDSLLVHFHGRGRAAVSIEVGDNAYVRLDRAAGQIVGLHLENFLRALVPRHPELLDHSAVFGIDHADVSRETSGSISEANKRIALAALAPLFGRPVAAAGAS